MTPRQWPGAYAAVVHSNADPTGRGRVQLKIPQVLGNAVSQWASPLGSFGTSAPAQGTAVTVMFIGGDVSHPAYMAATVSDTWHKLTLSNATGSGNGVNGLWYRLENDRTVAINLDITMTTGTTGTTIGTLPSAYWPATAQSIAIGWYGSAPASYSNTFAPHLAVTLSGLIVVYNQVTTISLCGYSRYALDLL